MFEKALKDHLIPIASGLVRLGQALRRWEGVFTERLDVSIRATVPAPVTDTDAATKLYVDTTFNPTIADIREVDGTPIITNPDRISFDQADGFVVTNPAGVNARVDLSGIPVTLLSGTYADLGATLTGTLAATELGGTFADLGAALTGTLDVADGGTGAATLASGSYLKGAGALPITTQVVPIPIADGGTGAITAAGARVTLDVPSNAEAVLDTLIDAKGDLLVGTAADTISRLAVGSNNLVLTTDSVEASGLRWGTSVPTGSVLLYGAATAPTGFLLCDGAAVSRTTFAALFAVIGTTFGAGDGTTTFNVPDQRSRSPIGAGQGVGLTNRALAATGGAETHTLVTSEIPSHTHTTAVRANNATAGTAVEPRGATDGSTGATGGDGAHNNMHPFLAMTFIIRT